MKFYRILCILRREHHYLREVIIDENTSRSYCKCDKWLEFDWSLMGGYKKTSSRLSDLIRKNEWREK